MARPRGLTEVPVHLRPRRDRRAGPRLNPSLSRAVPDSRPAGSVPADAAPQDPTSSPSRLLAGRRPPLRTTGSWLVAGAARGRRHGAVLSIGHLGDQIRDFVRDGATWHLPVTYVEEGDDLAAPAARFASPSTRGCSTSPSSCSTEIRICRSRCATCRPRSRRPASPH